MRVYELAKTYQITRKEMLSKLAKIDIIKRSHLSLLKESELSIIKYKLTSTNSYTTNEYEKIVSDLFREFDDTVFSESDINNEIKQNFSNLKNIDDLSLFLNKLMLVSSKQYEYKIERKSLTYYAYHCKNKYNINKIPKKSGGEREILIPTAGLKYIQRLLNLIFQVLYKNNLNAHGFVPNRSVITNSKKHIGKNYVLNLDLKDFFPSIHQARVWKIFQLPPFNLNQNLANLLANLVCY